MECCGETVNKLCFFSHTMSCLLGFIPLGTNTNQNRVQDLFIYKELEFPLLHPPTPSVPSYFSLDLKQELKGKMACFKL